MEGFVCAVLTLVCVGMLLVRAAAGRPVKGLILLLFSGVMFCCLLQSCALKAGLMCVLCAVIYYKGRDEVLLPTLNKAVLITGCDSGFGHDLARFLDSMGMRVFAGVLDEQSPGAVKLKEEASPNLIVLQLDITNSRQIAQAVQTVQSQTGDTGLWALVNNAGVLGYVCDGEITPIKMYKKYLDVNFLGSVETTQVFLPLIRRSKGRIISITSMAGEVPLTGFAGYGASKGALCLFNGAIRQELSRWGVKVIIVQPGAFKTNILGSREQWERVQEEILSGLSRDVLASYGEEYIRSMQKRLLDMSSASSADTRPFLEDLQHAILSPTPKRYYYPGTGALALTLLYRYCPTSVSDRLFSQMFTGGGIRPAGL